MGSETKANNGGNGGAAAAATGGGGFRSKMEHYLYSGDKKHVFAGILIISAVFAVPWFLMNRGSYLSLSVSLDRHVHTHMDVSLFLYSNRLIIRLIPYLFGFSENLKKKKMLKF
ncbi:hypothetical protein CsSME_00052695 [Camellia sinensis var. sinensis]